MYYDFQTATHENRAAAYRLRGTSHLPSSGGGITLNLSQPENQAMARAELSQGRGARAELSQGRVRNLVYGGVPAWTV